MKPNNNMKHIYTLLVALVTIQFAMAQNPIPNPGFETWSSGTPTSWSNSSNVTQSTDAHSGTYAVKGEYNGSSSPQLSVGTGNGISTNVRWSYLNFYYKFNKTGTTTMRVSAYFDNPSYTIGSASSTISTGSSTYKAISIPVSYNLSGNPTDVTIDIMLDNETTGSYFIIDDISLSATPLAVEDIERESASLFVYPNPVKDVVQVRFENPKGSEAIIQISNMAGQVVKEISTTADYVAVNLAGLPAGNYVATVRNEETVQTKRLVVE